MTLSLAHIFRHPIKGIGYEEIATARLEQGACLPWDRHWAVAHDAARLDPDTAAQGPGAAPILWTRCLNFLRGAGAPSLMAVRAELQEGGQEGGEAVTLHHPDREPLTLKPDIAEAYTALAAWLAPLLPEDRRQPAKLVKAARGMTDSAISGLSLLSLSSLSDLSQRLGQPLHLARFRGNLWLDGLPAWQEFDLIGRHMRIGQTILQVEEPITRCKATTANPETGRIDADTLGQLKRDFGHQDFGVQTSVIESGAIARGDRVELL